MNARLPRRAGLPPRTHPYVQAVQRRYALQTAAGALIALALAMAIALAMPKPEIALVLVAAIGGVGIVYLMVEPRLEVTVLLLALYLGMLDGPVKLGSGGHEAATVIRDVLIFAVSVGAIVRLLRRQRTITLPPLSGWVVLFIALVLAETFNPYTASFVKALGGFRQQLEFVPFFFFGYALMRSKRRFRQFFIVLGALALANAIVSLYQSKIGASGLASWGPGYRELINGTANAGAHTGLSARTYIVEGVARVRPPGLGKDAGFGGSVGAIALPCVLALTAMWGRHRGRWVPIVFVLGALVAVLTGLGRLQVVGAVIGVALFLAFAVTTSRRIARVLLTVVAVALFAIPAVAATVAAEAPGTFSRYAEISPENAASAKDKKTGELANLPHSLSIAPFGVGLSSAGAASGFGGKVTVQLEGKNVGGENQYSYLGKELGVPGLVLWLGLLLNVLVLAVTRLRGVADPEVRIAIAGVVAVLATFVIEGISGSITGTSAGAAFFWFGCGTAGYWLGGRRRLVRARAPAQGMAPPPLPVGV